MPTRAFFEEFRWRAPQSGALELSKRQRKEERWIGAKLMGKRWCCIIALFWLSGYSIATAAESNMRYFPLKVGDTRAYISFYANRVNPRKKALLSVSTWQKVLEEHKIHGMRVFVVRNSHGAVTQNSSGLDLGSPETIASEDIYFITSKGVDWRAHYISDKDAEYKRLRQNMLNSFRKMSKQQLIQQMDNWILPFPPTAKSQREYDGGTGTYKVLSEGDRSLLRGDKVNVKMIGVEGASFGKWNITRWFEPGVGLVQTESPNTDPETAAQFPVLCQQLMNLSQ